MSGGAAPLRVALIGDGKMGRTLAALVPERGGVVATVFGARGDAQGRQPDAASLAGADVAIEFTVPSAAVDNALACLAAGVPVVVGTTGWYDRLDEVRAAVAAHDGALLHATNFSLGVNLFAELVREAARRFRPVPGFDAHLVETHHAQKLDAPSGTARTLADAARDGLGRDLPITSVRTGHVPGTHEVLFDAPFEQVRLVHEARDRRVFAEGALMAARWLVGRRGLFTMRDVLALDDPETR